MAFIATFSRIDSFSRMYSKQFELEATTLADALVQIATIELAYAPVTTGGDRKKTLSYLVEIGSADPAAGSNRDVGATFVGLTVDGDTAVVKVAGFLQSLADEYGNIPLDNADVAAFLGLFEAAGPCRVSDGEVVEVWLRGTLDK